MKRIAASVASYERWLRAQLGGRLVEEDLALKHDKMRESPFVFLRATYWRFAEMMAAHPAFADGLNVLGIGDTHLENFGTWRDAEGRLVWGVNDFDEAAMMPYELDLIRLAASAMLARTEDGPNDREICDNLAEGYLAGLECPEPFILEQNHRRLREAVVLPEKKRHHFWRRLREAAEMDASNLPEGFEQALRGKLPADVASPRFARRVAGTGSLGRTRIVALANWRGGPLVREAKAVTTSAWDRTRSRRGDPKGIVRIAHGRCRSPDPHFDVVDATIVRRLSPSSRKLEVEDGNVVLLSDWMLEYMGREIAACHVGEEGAVGEIQHHFVSIGRDRLHNFAVTSMNNILDDYNDFS